MPPFVVRKAASLGGRIHQIEACEGDTVVVLQAYFVTDPKESDLIDLVVHIGASVDEHLYDDDPQNDAVVMSGTVALAESNRLMISHGGLLCSLPMGTFKGSVGQQALTRLRVYDTSEAPSRKRPRRTARRAVT